MLSPYSLETPLIVIGLWSVNGVASFGNVSSLDAKTVANQLTVINAKFVLASKEFVSLAKEAANTLTGTKPSVLLLDDQVRLCLAIMTPLNIIREI